jgi:hypothetical protein
VSEEIILMINEVLLKLDKKKSSHTALLYPAELGGFEKAKDEDFNGMRMLLEREIEAPKRPSVDE